MKRKCYSEEQIITIMEEHEAGLSAEDVIRKHGIVHSRFHRWKSKFGGMEVSDAKRLNIVDDNSRVCVDQSVYTSISGQRIANYLDFLG